MTSWFLDLLRRSQILSAAPQVARALAARLATGPRRPRAKADGHRAALAHRLSLLAFGLVIVAMACGAWRLIALLSALSVTDWGHTVVAALWTLLRVLTATALGTLWALPAGLAIGLSPRLSRVLQPVVQVVASFPAPMLFPLAIAGFSAAGISLGWGSILLMLLGTQWYILFNVVAGAMAVPADLKEAARSYRLSIWQTTRQLYVPAVFPYLVTGWVTAAGGAWNASIVAEYVTFRREVLTAVGLGAQISRAAEAANFPLLAASIVVMSAVVVVFNRTVWRRLYELSQQRYSLNK
jgi:NitT/TauT family transport system permease protein